MKQRCQPLVTVQRITRLAVLDEPRVAGFHHHTRPQMLVSRQVNMLHLRHHPLQNALKTMRPFDALDPRRRARLFLGELLPLPDRDQLTGLLHEQNFPLLGIDRIRHEHQRRFLLIHAGEIEEVVVLFESHRPVRVRRVNVIRQDDHHAVRLQQAAEVLAVADKKLRANGFVSHARTSSHPPPQGNLDFSASEDSPGRVKGRF